MGKYIDHLYLGQNEIKDVVIDKLSSAPSSPVEGQVYYDTTNKHFYGLVNAGWEILDNIYSSYSDILSTSGDGIVSSGLTDGYFVTFSGGKLVGVDPTTIGSTHTHTLLGDVGGTTAASVVNKIKGTTVSATPTTTGQVLYYDGTNYTPTLLKIALSGDITVASTTITGSTSLAVTVSKLRGFNFTSSEVNSNGFLTFNTSTGWSVTTNNFLTASTGVTTLNGTSGAITLAAGTGISISGTSTITIANTGVTSNVAGSNIVVSGATGASTISLATTLTGLTSITSTTVNATNLSTTNFTLNGQTLTYSAIPNAATDIITFGHIQNQSFGLRDWKESCRVATTANLSVTATTTTLTATAVGVLTIDGVTVTSSDRILVKSQTNTAQNGIYRMTTTGTASVAYVLTRESDFNTMGSSGNITSGAYVYVSEGTANARTGWVLSNIDSALTTLGTSSIDFVQFTGASLYTAGTGLTLSSGQFSITNTGVSAASYGVATPGATQAIPTFTVNAQGQLTAAGSFLTSTITNLGTITTGTWNASIIGLAYGGTGVNATSISQNYAFMGPSSGSGNATFRAIVLGDISTALSTWTGSTSITTLGTIATGTWNGTAISAVKGGTGITSYAVGDMLYADSTTTLAKRTIGSTGNVLTVSGGVPTWGQVNLASTASVTGVLPIANGGTGLSTTPTNGKLLIGNGSGYTLANLTAGNGIVITNSAGGITISNAVLVYEATWNPSTTPATLITTGPFTGYYQYIVTHSLGINNTNTILVNNATGEELMANIYNAATLNAATITYGSTSTITIRMTAAGWAAISALTAITIRTRG